VHRILKQTYVIPCISSPFWFTSASTEWRRRIWKMSFSSRRTLPPEHGFVLHRHCLFAVHGCRLSATERFRSLLPVVYLEQSAASCHLRSIAVCLFSSSPSRDLYSCSACAVTRPFQTILYSFLFVCFAYYLLSFPKSSLGRCTRA